jgi:molybdate transport system substrate-binding protein
VRRTAVLLAALLAVAGCGDDERSAAKPDVVVSAATSLKTAMTRYAEGFGAATVRLSFGGSDELAAQIRQGVRPDVYAAANTSLPEQLHADGLVEQPVVFAGNRLVIAVPADAGRIASLDDLAADGVRIAVGAASVPVGKYTREVLDRAGAGTRDAILANVRSEEPDVGGVIGKLTQGAVDAGFVYRTDAHAAGGALKAIELPRSLQPHVAYAAAVVAGAREPALARRFVEGLLTGEGAAALQAAGFTGPPR